MSHQTKPVLLVSGASGHLGRRVIELLVEKQAGQIIAGSRTPENLSEFSKHGVTLRRVDFDDAVSLPEAFAGVDRLLLISTDTLGQPGQRLNQHRAAVQAAEAAGVSHVVYTSLTNPGPESLVSFAPDHRGTEEALAASKVSYTILRNNLYADMLVQTLGQALQMGKLVNAIGDGKAAYVTREDCAQIATSALAGDFAGRRVLDVTGPDALSQQDLAALLSDLSGKQIPYMPISHDALVQNLTGAGLPPPVVQLIASFDAATAAGQFADVTGAVAELTGQKPIRVADFLAEHRELAQERVG